MHSLALGGTFPVINGRDRGFNVAADILSTTADGVSLNSLWTEFSDVLAQWNATRDPVRALFTHDTTDSFDQLPEPKNAIELEPASEFGIAQAVRATPGYMRMGFPLSWFDTRKAFTRKFLRDATSEQVRAQHSAILEADNRLLFRSVMSGVTNKVVAGSRAVNENGVTVYDLWDGSAGEIPPTFAGKTFTAAHSHYLVSGATVIDGGDLKTLIDTIQEHGYGMRSSNEQIIILANPVEADVIATFRRDPLDPAKNPYDFIPAVSAPAYLTDQTIVGDKAPATFNKLAIEGSYGDAWIHKNHFIPAGYVIAVATSGPNAGRNPLYFREHPQAASRGLVLLPEETRNPLVNAFYERGFGVGIRHRGAAAVVQVKAVGPYENPVWP